MLSLYTMNDKSVAAFALSHPDFDLLTHDFFGAERREWQRARGMSVDASPLSEEPSGELRTSLMGLQRLARIRPDMSLIEGLMTKSLDSAAKISTLSADSFAAEAEDLFESRQAADDFYRQACDIKMRVSHFAAAIKDMVASPAYSTRAFNTADAEFDFYRQLPSYTSLFGNMDYLETDQGQTIFSPSAYFFDLMRIIDEYITKPNRGSAAESIPSGYTLEERRPDIFACKLTPDNAFAKIPHIQIVNAVLAENIATLASGQAAKHLLALGRYPFLLPFIQPLAELRAAMEALHLPLCRVYAVLAVEPRPDADSVAVSTADFLREAAGLSVSDLARLSTADSSASGVGEAYGYDIPSRHGTDIGMLLPYPGTGTVRLDATSRELSGTGTQFTSQLRKGDQVRIDDLVRTVEDIKSDTLLTLAAKPGVSTSPKPFTILPQDGLDMVEVFLERTGLDQDSLDALLTQNLSPAEKKAECGKGFFINASGESLPPLSVVTSNDPVNPTQRMAGLSLNRLDRLSRFIRLSRLCGIDFADLQWLMDCLGVDSISPKLVADIGRVLELQKQWGWQFLDITAWCGGLKSSGKIDDRHSASQFDRIFNKPELLQGKDPYATCMTRAF